MGISYASGIQTNIRYHNPLTNKMSYMAFIILDQEIITQLPSNSFLMQYDQSQQQNIDIRNWYSHYSDHYKCMIVELSIPANPVIKNGKTVDYVGKKGTYKFGFKINTKTL